MQQTEPERREILPAGVRAIPADTSPEAFRAQLEALRAMPGSRRFQVALEMTDNAMRIAAAGIRRRHPEFSEEQVRLTLIRMRLGDDLFRKVFSNSVKLSTG